MNASRETLWKNILRLYQAKYDGDAYNRSRVVNDSKAAGLPISQGLLQRIEWMETDVRLSSLESIAKFFGCSVESLTQKSDETKTVKQTLSSYNSHVNPKLREEIDFLNKSYISLNNQQKELVIAQLEVLSGKKYKIKRKSYESGNVSDLPHEDDVFQMPEDFIDKNDRNYELKTMIISILSVLDRSDRTYPESLINETASLVGKIASVDETDSGEEEAV